MNRSINLYKDIAIGILYLCGIFGFSAGEFLVSSLMIGAASFISNFHFHETA